MCFQVHSYQHCTCKDYSASTLGAKIEVRSTLVHMNSNWIPLVTFGVQYVYILLERLYIASCTSGKGRMSVGCTVQFYS